MNNGQGAGLSLPGYTISSAQQVLKLPSGGGTGFRASLIENLHKFMESFGMLRLGYDSRRVYESRAKQFLKFVLSLREEEFDVANDEQAFVYAYSVFIVELQSQRSVQQTTVNNYNRFGKSFAEYCGWNRNIVPNIVRVESVQRLTTAESQLYLDTLDKFGSVRNRAMIHLLLLEGLKIDQVLNLQIDDVVVYQDGMVVVRNGKYGFVEGYVRETAANAIHQWSQLRLAETGQNGRACLFPGAGSGPISRGAADFALRKYGWKCGIVASVRGLKHRNKLLSASVRQKGQY